MARIYARQPPGYAKTMGGLQLNRRLTAQFLFNGSFRSSVRGRTGNPVVTSGPRIAAKPSGSYALGNGSGKVVTDLLPSALGVAGAAPRTFVFEFDMLDANVARCLFSLGDSSGRTRSQFTVQTNTTYRTVQLATFGNDTTFNLFGTGGTGARVFMAISYDGNVSVTVNAWSTLNSNGQVIAFSRTFNLGGPLITGDTVPLNLMGGGTYNFTSFNAGLYFLAIYGGRVLSLAEIERIRADRYQTMAAPARFPYAAIASPIQEAIAGIFASTLSGSQLLASGVATNRAALASSLDGAVLAASGAIGSAPSGALAASLNGASMSAAGAVRNRGALASSLADAGLAASGIVASNASGAFASTLDGAALFATGYPGKDAPPNPVRPYRWRVMRRHFSNTGTP
jgi:hypothetical protein